MSELDGTRTISIPGLSLNYVDFRLESIGIGGELYYRERGTHAPNAGTRWHELFGTPERAARTLDVLNKCSCDEDYICDDCALHGNCDLRYGDYDALLEWLRGDS